MTVLRANTADGHAYARLRPSPSSPQVQSWARGLEAASGRQRPVITEKWVPAPAVSARGVRRDVLAAVAAVLLAVFLVILIADVNALQSGGSEIGRLSRTIDALESGNAQLRQQVSAAMRHPVLLRKAAEESGETLNEQVVFLSPAPQE